MSGFWIDLAIINPSCNKLGRKVNKFYLSKSESGYFVSLTVKTKTYLVKDIHLQTWRLLQCEPWRPCRPHRLQQVTVISPLQSLSCLSTNRETTSSLNTHPPPPTLTLTLTLTLSATSALRSSTPRTCAIPSTNQNR